MQGTLTVCAKPQQLAIAIGLAIAVAAPAYAQPGAPGGAPMDPTAAPIHNPPPQRPRRVVAPRVRINRPPATQPAPVELGPPPKIEIDELVYEFGEKLAGPPVEHTFKLKNVGEGILRIRSVRPSCGCTVAGQWEKTVKPGGSWELPITLRTTHYKGPQRKSITVTTNDPEMGTVRFMIKGTLKPRWIIKPRASVVFGRIDNDKPVTQTLTLENALDEAVEITEVKVSHPDWFKAELRVVEKGRKYELDVVTIPPLREGSTRSLVSLETTSKEEPRVTLPIQAYVPPRLALRPPMLSIQNEPDRPLRRRLTLTNIGDTEVKVTDVLVDVKGITTEVEPQERSDNKVQYVWLNIPEGLKLPPSGCKVTVLTDDPQFPKFEARVRGYTAGHVVRPRRTPSPPARPKAPSSTGG
jgi:hypothetical protein